MASPFGIGLGDIVRAIEICVWIRDTYFKPELRADFVYAAFWDELRSFETQLRLLRQAFESASVRAATITSCKELLDCKEESATIVGPVERTLKECKSFLKENSHLASGNPTLFVKITWHITPHGHARVEELRSKIKAHSYRISRTIEPIELQLLTEVHAGIQDILDLLRNKTLNFPAIPSETEALLEKALIRSSPTPLVDRFSIHLQHGVSALLLHLQECTVYFPQPGTALPLELKLRLLKAHWLVVTLGASKTFNESRPGSLCRQIIKQAASDIERVYNSWQIKAWTKDDFESLDEAAFTIWPPKQTRTRRDITDAKIGEEKLEELPLVSLDDEQSESLVLFQVNDRTLRTVSVRRYQDEPGGRQTIDRTEKVFDPRTDSFVPLYAVAKSRNRIWSVDVNQGKGRFDSYELESRQDVFKLQKAFVGYEPFEFFQPESCADIFCVVTHQPPSLLAHITRDNLLEGRGELQIWQWPIRTALSRARQLSMSTNNSSSNDTRTFRSNSTTSTVSEVFTKLDPTLFSVTEVNDGGHVFMNLPPPPLLVSFLENKTKETYTICTTELSDLQITESGPYDDKNSQIVLQHVHRKTFSMRRITVRKSKMELFNLCALVIPGYEGSRGMKSPTVETLDCTSMVLFFKDDKEQTGLTGERKRWDFELGFKLIDLKRMEQIENAQIGLTYARHQAHKPRKRSTFDDSGRRFSAQSQSQNLDILRSATYDHIVQASSSSQTLAGVQNKRTDSVPHDVEDISPLSPTASMYADSVGKLENPSLFERSKAPSGKSRTRVAGPSPKW